MCGIAGYSIKENSLPSTERRLEKTSSLLSHRGPDGSGIYFDNRIGLAHRRLAIIDIKGGFQPLTDATGETTVVFNGEIYNFSELKHELQITDINTYLPGDILFYSDHMSMAHGLELRSPFLDHDVLEFALSLPSEYRTTTDRKEKRILRDAFSDRISKAMFERPEKGFSIPPAKWVARFKAVLP